MTRYTPEETADEFAARVEQRTGLKVNRIPDAEPMYGGKMVCFSLLYGEVILVDFVEKEWETGADLSGCRAVLVNRSGELAPADPDADGFIPRKDKT